MLTIITDAPTLTIAIFCDDTLVMLIRCDTPIDFLTTYDDMRSRVARENETL